MPDTLPPQTNYNRPTRRLSFPSGIFRPLFFFVLFIAATYLIHSWFFAATRTMTVTGLATRKIQPETAVVSFSLNFEGTDRNVVINEGDQKFNVILESLKQYGLQKVDRAPYQISDLSQLSLTGQASSSSPRFRYTNAARLTLNDPNQTEEVIAHLYSIGATQVGQPVFIPKDAASISQELRTEAVENARVRADEMAKASGGRVGKVITIQEGASNSETGTAVSALDVDTNTNNTNLQTLGEIELSSTVVVTYEIR